MHPEDRQAIQVGDHPSAPRAQAGRSRDEIVATEALPGFEDHVSPFALLSLEGVLGVAYDELSEG